MFTIHTPVSAGNERFEADLVRTLATPRFRARQRGIERILELGRGVDGDDGQFDMTGFSLRMSCAPTRVSQLHAETANATWQAIVRQPILGITNGVHPPTWLGRPSASCTRASAPTSTSSRTRTEADRFWERLAESPTSGCGTPTWSRSWSWRPVRAGPAASPAGASRRGPGELAEVDDILDPGILTIGFARRFATYKRAALLFSDEERLARLLWDHERPVQIVFAGKAHPADRPGQGVIQDIFSAAARSASRAACSSSRTTTSASAATSSRAWTSGSTTRAGRWRHRARAA